MDDCWRLSVSSNTLADDADPSALVVALEVVDLASDGDEVLEVRVQMRGYAIADVSVPADCPPALSAAIRRAVHAQRVLLARMVELYEARAEQRRRIDEVLDCGELELTADHCARVRASEYR